MNRRITLLLLLLPALFAPLKSWASHAMGADLTYTCVGPDTYEIRLTFFRDCGGISAPATVNIAFESVSCGLTTNITLNQDSLVIGSDTYFSGDEVSPLCTDSLPNSECNGGDLPGVEIYIYTGTITLPASCPDWVLSYGLCCRNDDITNLDDPDSYDIHVEATIDNSGGLCNSSPFFTTFPVPYICVNEPFSFNHGAVDPDGDSLVYSLIQPLDDTGVPIPYAPGSGFSPTYPMSTTTGTFGFDPVSGQMSFTPDIEQVAVVAVLVEEYRDGVLIGTTMRDIQIVVIDCTTGVAPVWSGAFNSLEGGVAIDSNSIEACPGDTIRFFLDFTDADVGDTISFITNVDLVLTGATFTALGTNPLQLFIEWFSPPTDTGFYNFSVTVEDNSCPIVSSNAYSFDIDLTGRTNAGPDQTYCPGGIPAVLTATGGTAFTWTPVAGLSDPGSATTIATPAATTAYAVESNLSDFCNKDTVIVNVVSDFPYTLSPGDSICRYDVATIGTLTPDATYAPYTYSWGPTAGLSDPDSNITEASPFNTTWYSVIMESALGCRIEDSVRVVIQGAIPQVNAIADDYLICPGTGAQLDLVPQCGADYEACGATTFAVAGEDVFETDAQTPYKGDYDDGRIQILYRAQDLKDAGFHGGSIESLGFFVSEKNSTVPYQNFTISVACSSDTVLTSSFQSGLDTYFGPVDYSTVSGWNMHDLDQVLHWNGVDNLLIEVCFNNPDASFTSFDKVQFSNMEYQAVTNEFAILADGCGLEESPSTSDNRPNLRVRYCNQDVNDLDITWTPTTGLSDPSIQNPIADPDSGPITYIVTVDDAGCSITDTLTLGLDNSLVLDAGADQSICSNESVAINVVPTGTPSPDGFGWSWEPATGLSNPFGPNTTASPESTTTYVVSAFSEQGCPIFDTVTVNVLEFLATAGPETLICEGETLQLEATGGVTYSWSPAAGLSCTDCPDPVASPSQTQTYTVAITSADGCSDTLRTTVFVNPLPFVGAEPDTVLFVGESVGLSSSEGVTYLWSPSDGLDDPSSPNPLATPNMTTTYTLTMTGANGCVNTDQVTIEVIELLEIFVPTAFSPNGDGQNDFLSIINRGLAGLDEFSIYNRWGELVFSTNDPDQGWDGTYKGEPQPTGTYVVVLRATSLLGTALAKTVNVQLVR
jgi:gliding motility-associated-like protein